MLSSNSSPVSGTYACDSRRWHHAGFPAVWTNDAGMTCVSGKGEAAHCAAAVWLTAPLSLLSPSVSWKVPFSLEFLSNLCCCITPTSWWVTPWACCWWQQTPSLALLGYINHLSPSIFYTGLPFLSALIPFIVPGPCPLSVTDMCSLRVRNVSWGSAEVAFVNTLWCLLRHCVCALGTTEVCRDWLVLYML